MKRALLLLSLASSCTGLIGSNEPGPTGGGDAMLLADGGTLEDGGCVPVGRNDEVRLALAPACAGCHLTGSKPYWASLTAFETMVYDPKYVVAGDPDSSGLIKLLKGTAPGSFKQMPPGETYQAALDRGAGTMTIAQVEQWIRELGPRGAVREEPIAERFTVRRLTAEEMVLSAMSQLGLTLEDFIDTSRPTWQDEGYTVRGGRFFVWPKDWAPGISTQYVSDARTVERYEALGGMAAVDNRTKDTNLSPAAVQTIVQLSQAWCKRAIEKPGNTAVLRHVTLADKSPAKTTEIKRNIGALYLRMLSEPPSDATIDELYTKVYLPAEATSTKVAWTAVCASFMRHPLWLTF